MPEEPFEPASAQIPEGQLLSESDFASGGVTPETPAETPVQTAPSQGTSQEVAPLGIRDVLSQLGYQTPQHITDDYSALAYMAQRAALANQLEAQSRQQDVYRQLGQQLLPHASQIQQYLQQQQAPAGPKAWEPPPFDPRWQQLVEQDQTSGMYVGKPGTPLEVVQAVNKWADWQRDFARNPGQVLAPMFDDYRRQAVEEAKREIQASQAQYQRQAQVNSIVQQNSGWFYAKDSSGGLLRDPITGQPQSTPLGAQYVATVQALSQMGVTDPVHKDQLARQLLDAQIREATETASTSQVAAARQAQALKATNRNRSPLQALGSLAGAETPGYTPPDQARMSFADRMRQSFAQNGITDADIAWPG